jgi:type IV secretion system protein VirD4
MTRNTFFYRPAVIASRLNTFFAKNHHLHTARFAHLHELTNNSMPRDAITGRNTAILLARTSYDRLLCATPTTTQRELGHTLLVGKHRSGKGLNIETNLLTWPYSVIVNDIKGELWHRTAGFRQQGVGGTSLRFDPRGFGCRFDPLAGKTTDLELRSAATTLLHRPDEGQNASFIERATTMLVAIFTAAILEGERALPFTYKLMNEGLYATASILEIITRKHNAYPNLAKKFLDTDYDKADFESKFLQDCWSTLTARMSKILTKESVRCFTGSDFSAKDIITSTTPVSVYLSWPEEHILSLAPLVQLVWDSLINGMLGYYDSPNVQGKDCRRVLCVLDEIFRTGLPKLPEYTTTVSGRNISFLISAQSIRQMEKTYDRATAEVLLGQMDATVFYRPAATDIATPEYIERACGYTSGFAHSKTAHDKSTSKGESEQRVPLMPAHETRHMDPQEIIGLVNGLHPIREKRLDRYAFPELTKRGNLPAPPVSPLPEPDLPVNKQTHHSTTLLPDGRAGNPDDHRNHTANGHTLWRRNRKFPKGYIDPDKRY